MIGRYQDRPCTKCKRSRMLTPRALRDQIHKEKGKMYSLCNIRKIMKKQGLSAKRSTTEYSSVDDAKTVKK